MKKKQTIEDLLNDPRMNERLKERLYSKQSLLGKESPFSEILQQMVNTMLEGEIESFLTEERAAGSVNKRNGRTPKRARSGQLHHDHVQLRRPFDAGTPAQARSELAAGQAGQTRRGAH